jgi:hypothetical protein
MHRRPVTLQDVTGFLKMTVKQARKDLFALEELGRIAKVPVRKGTNGRICAGWVIDDNENLPHEIRNVCQVCATRRPSQSYGDERLCETCFMAVKNDGQRIVLTNRDETELSLWHATMITTPNEHTLC